MAATNQQGSLPLVVRNIAVPEVLTDTGDYCSFKVHPTERNDESISFYFLLREGEQDKKVPASTENASSAENTTNSNSNLPSSLSRCRFSEQQTWNLRYLASTEEISKVSPTKKPKVSLSETNGEDLSFLIKAPIIKASNRELVHKLEQWAREVHDAICLTISENRSLYNWKTACRSQMKMAIESYDVCDVIMASGLPIHLMGYYQMFETIPGLTFEYAQLLENLSVWEDFDIYVRHSACHSKFYISTVHSGKNNSQREMMYGINDAYDV